MLGQAVTLLSLQLTCLPCERFLRVTHVPQAAQGLKMAADG